MVLLCGTQGQGQWQAPHTDRGVPQGCTSRRSKVLVRSVKRAFEAAQSAQSCLHRPPLR